jgi:2-(1,2-epoxy-1,2-dihydrophenyl)acetyl-CoA isomerase
MHVVDGVAWLTIDRPQVGNAIDAGVITAFHRALDSLHQKDTDIRSLVITGEGASFCSGIDLHGVLTFKGHPKEDRNVVARDNLDHLICRLVEFNLPIVAAVQGPAIGAGMTLSLTADIIVMSDQAYMQPTFTRLGFVPDQGITYLLPRLIGAARARAVLLLSERIDARTALEWGLAWRVFAPGEFTAGVQALAHRLASGPTRVLGLARPLWCGGDLSAMRAQMKRERGAQESAFQYSSCVEGIQAFFEKREPEFPSRKV